MIEPVTTITAISLLVAYLTGAAEEAGKQTVEGAESGGRAALRRLHELISGRAAEDEYATETLSRLEERPGDERRQRALADVLDEIVEADAPFGRQLEQAVTDAQHSVSGTISVSDSGITAIGGSVSQQGRNVAGRDLTIGPGTPDPSANGG